MGKICQNCGETVSDKFHDVFFPEDADVDRCINCPDEIENGFVPSERE